MMPRQRSLLAMAFFCADDIQPLEWPSSSGSEKCTNASAGFSVVRYVGRLLRDLLAVVAGPLVHADGAGRHDVAQLGLAGEERRRQPGVLRVREDGRRLDVALARPPGVPGQAVHASARRPTASRRAPAASRRRGWSARDRCSEPRLRMRSCHLQVQRRHGVGAQPVFADDEDVVDLRARLLDGVERRATVELSVDAAPTAGSRPARHRRARATPRPPPQCNAAAWIFAHDLTIERPRRAARASLRCT